MGQKGENMIVQQEVQKLFHNLLHREAGIIVVDGSEILVRMIDHGEKVKLTTPVYWGGNYIPSRVRQAAGNKNLIKSELISFKLIIDEEKFEIFLQYIEDTETLDLNKLKDDLEEFAWLADEWRLLLRPGRSERPRPRQGVTTACVCFPALIRPYKIINSYMITMGTPSATCVKTSGGVTIAAMMKLVKQACLRLLLSAS